MELPLMYEDIARILPHRYPFLLVDRVIALEPSNLAVGIKNVTANEPFFQGHFPGNPIMPGVLIVEALAQVGGILARLSTPEILEGGSAGATLFVSMDKVKFRKPVVPGDQLRLEVQALRRGSRVWKVGGKGLVGDELAAEAVLVATIG